MNTSANDIFMKVLVTFVSQYDLTINFPYSDSYFELIKNGKVIGGMNPDGHNLLYCLTELCEILKDELI